MNRFRVFALAWMTSASLCFAAQPARAGTGAGALDLVNGTGEAITNLFIRRTGTASWQPLPAKPAAPARGARAASTFTDVDCAFDIKATLEDSQIAVWTGVNLCEVKSVSLNRNASGATWVDYE